VARAKAQELALLSYVRALGAPRPLAQPSASGASSVPGGLSYPTHVAELPSGCLVVSESATSQLVVLGSDDGAVLRTVGSKGRGAADLSDPRGLALADGALLVADSHNRRLVRCDLT
jgi:glucose/arabinose dehydrogenase